jgi:hypothetical protein
MRLRATLLVRHGEVPEPNARHCRRARAVTISLPAGIHSPCLRRTLRP